MAEQHFPFSPKVLFLFLFLFWLLSFRSLHFRVRYQKRYYENMQFEFSNGGVKGMRCAPYRAKFVVSGIGHIVPCSNIARRRVNIR